MEARKKRQHRIGLGVLKLHFKTCNIHGSSLRLYFCHVKTAYLFAKFLEPSRSLQYCPSCYRSRCLIRKGGGLRNPKFENAGCRVDHVSSCLNHGTEQAYTWLG